MADASAWVGRVELKWKGNDCSPCYIDLLAGSILIGWVRQGDGESYEGQWRALIAGSDTPVGWFENEQIAKDALIDAVVKAFLETQS